MTSNLNSCSKFQTRISNHICMYNRTLSIKDIYLVTPKNDLYFNLISLKEQLLKDLKKIITTYINKFNKFVTKHILRRIQK